MFHITGEGLEVWSQSVRDIGRLELELVKDKP